MSEFVEDPELYRAIGRVATESSQFDEVVREMLSDLIDGGVQTWVLFEGQSSEWLSETFKSVLAETPKAHVEYNDRFRDLFAAMGALRLLRNCVIHGTWRYEIIVGEEEGYYFPRPWGLNDTGEPQYCCVRSRLRKGFEERMFTVADVDELATRISSVRQAIVETFRELMEFMKWGPTLANWPTTTKEVH